jgi:hypothetical protein
MPPPLEVLRTPPMVVCPGCGQFHAVGELRRCGCGWTGVALPTPPGELPLVLARSALQSGPLDRRPDELARWRFLASDAGLDYAAGVACGVCKSPPRSPSALALQLPSIGPMGVLIVCPFCVLRIAHDLVGGPI